VSHNYTLAQMRRALEVGWGDLGARVAEHWLRFNREYFAGRLKPLPVFLTPATPYGQRLGWCCSTPEVTHIALAWADAELALLGKLPDRELGAQSGRSRESVKRKRCRRRIPAAAPATRGAHRG
jgi:hypothetical protein